MVGWFVNNELERMWKETVVAYFKALTQHSRERESEREREQPIRYVYALQLGTMVT
jgi:hypothetical protein